MPTRSPTLTPVLPLVCSPIATTRPMPSWPAISIYSPNPLCEHVLYSNFIKHSPAASPEGCLTGSFDDIRNVGVRLENGSFWVRGIVIGAAIFVMTVLRESLLMITLRLLVLYPSESSRNDMKTCGPFRFLCLRPDRTNSPSQSSVGRERVYLEKP